jgi:hypothetical protein
LTLLHLAMALLHLALTLLQLLLYLHQQLGHIISGVYGQGPKEACSDAAMSDRATYEISPCPHLTAVTNREFRVGNCSELRLSIAPPYSVAVPSHYTGYSSALVGSC